MNDSVHYEKSSAAPIILIRGNACVCLALEAGGLLFRWRRPTRHAHTGWGRLAFARGKRQVASGSSLDVPKLLGFGLWYSQIVR
jgi:hypothetical protein